MWWRYGREDLNLFAERGWVARFVLGSETRKWGGAEPCSTNFIRGLTTPDCGRRLW